MTPGKYDRQLVIGLLNGPADALTPRQAEDLDAKQRKAPLASAVVLIPAGADSTGASSAGAEAEAALRRELRGEGEAPLPLSARSRLYLIGHGDWRRQTLSGWNAERIADLLVRAGLTAVRVISVVADELGRDRTGVEPADLHEPPDSFASQLHASLLHRHGIATVVMARVYPTIVVGEGAARGTKRTLDANDASKSGEHHRPHSKLRFSWEDGVQRREWSDD
jgi:hypothetical protein